MCLLASGLTVSTLWQRFSDLFAEMRSDAAVEDQPVQFGGVGEDAVDDQSAPAFVVYTLTGI